MIRKDQANFLAYEEKTEKYKYKKKRKNITR
jgi:hypothetical protein